LTDKQKAREEGAVALDMQQNNTRTTLVATKKEREARKKGREGDRTANEWWVRL